MPLAATVVGALAFYLAALEERRGWIFIVGVISIELGALMHPYFPGYWAAVVCIGFVTALIEGRCHLQTWEFVKFCDLRLLVAGMATWGIIGAMTWMRGAPALSFDPFQWVHRDALVPEFLDYSHLSFIFGFGFDLGASADQLWFGPRRIVLYAMIAPAAVYPLLPYEWRRQLRRLAPPLLLALASLVISATLSSISYVHHYWILDRQWVASLALMPIAVVWYMGELGRIADQQYRGLSVLLATGCIVVFCAALQGFVPQRIAVLRQDASDRAIAAPGPRPRRPVPTDNAGWVALANANIAAGGSVWPIFAKFYGR